MDWLRRDLRFALRGFRRAPGFFVTAIAVLALGIGMSVAMFTVFRSVLLERLPVVDQDRAVVMYTYRADPNTDYVTGTKDLWVVRHESRTMRDIAAVAHWPATATPFLDGDRPVELARGIVAARQSRVPGPGPEPTRLAREVRWRLGRDRPPPRRPVGAYRLHDRGGRAARLRLPVGSRVLDADVVGLGEYHGVHAVTFGEAVLGDLTPVLRVLTAAVGLLMLIACLNVGNLLLLRASSRARELAVRRAVGAGSVDIVRQLLAEAGALAVVGGGLGLAFAAVLLRLLVRFAPPRLPRLDEVQLAGPPVAVAIATSALAVLVFGVLPALIAARTNLASPLRVDARSGRETKRRRGVRQALVASQIALAMIMLAGASLLARSLARLEQQDSGYRSDHLSVLWFSWDARRIDSTAKLAALGDRLMQRLEAVPGVEAATQRVAPPLLGNGVWQIRFDREGQTAAEADANPSTAVDFVGPDYFATFGIPVVRGRPFRESDGAGGPLVAVVSALAARRLWPGCPRRV